MFLNAVPQFLFDLFGGSMKVLSALQVSRLDHIPARLPGTTLHFVRAREHES
jgi:hypothetical protein